MVYYLEINGLYSTFQWIEIMKDCNHSIANYSKMELESITIKKEQNDEENNIKQDIITIEKARQEFSKKNFQKSIEIFRTVEHKNLLIELDNDIIKFANEQVKKNEK